MKYCCDSFKHHIEHTCEQHPNDTCPDKILYKYNNGDYGIPIYPGGSYIIINNCPFCGKPLYEDNPLKIKE